jgi:hypothetical protein
MDSEAARVNMKVKKVGATRGLGTQGKSKQAGVTKLANCMPVLRGFA